MRTFHSVTGIVYKQPETIDDVKTLVLNAKLKSRKLVVHGARHSYPLSEQPADVSTDYVLLTYLNKMTAVDYEKGIFTVQTGCHVGYDPVDETKVSTLENSLVYQLDKIEKNGRRLVPPGWSVPELGGITHQTIGGFMATGSSGGSVEYAFSDAIRAVRVIYFSYDGLQDKTFTYPGENYLDDPFWAVSYAHLGLLGIVVEVTFKCEVAFNVKGTELTRKMEEDTLDFLGNGNKSGEDIKKILTQNHYCRLLWWPQKGINKVMIWSANQEKLVDWQNYKPKPYVNLPMFNGSPALANRIFGGIFYFLGNVLVRLRVFIIDHFGNTEIKRERIRRWFAALDIWLLKNVLKVFVHIGEKDFNDGWWRALPMDNEISDDFSPVKFTELWIDIDQAQDVLQTLQKFYTDPENAGNFCSELYAGKANNFWLSPGYGYNTIRVDVFWFGRNAGNPIEYFERFWRALEPYKFRYHWGKYLGFRNPEETKQLINKRYPKWSQFMALRQQHDPYCIFLSDYWKTNLDITMPANTEGTCGIPVHLSNLPIIDVHSHPCIKVHLFNYNFRKHHHPWSDLWPFGMHVDLPGMLQANVRVTICAHYVPEAGFGELKKTTWLFKILQLIFVNVFKRWEERDVPDDAFKKALNSIDKMNRQVDIAKTKYNVTTAKSLHEFNEAFVQGKTIVLHSVEGAHQLGSHSTNPQHYIDNLKILKAKGCCYLTLGHFFPNPVCDTGGGLPPSTAKALGYEVLPGPVVGLTPVGVQVVEWCLDNGMILCLKHSSVATRQQVYSIMDKRAEIGKPNIPVMFSHCGIREKAAPNMININDALMLPDINEMKQIKKYGGLIGLILMNYWLVGIEEDSPRKMDNAIEHIMETIDLLHTNLGDFENIAIGTDLDGFTQVPDDLRHIRFVRKLSLKIYNKYGLDVANKICHGNAYRMLQHGWK